jgi:GntR family transcriptional regulator/MocR family aminotransferase
VRNPTTTTTVGPVLLVELGHPHGSTLTAQVSSAIREAVASGRISPGSRLPSSRALAADLRVSRGVVVAAYARLADEGVLVSRPGSVTRVSETFRTSPVPKTATSGANAPGVVAIDLRPGPPDLSAFPRATWLSALRHTLNDITHYELGYVSPWGTDVLRAALAVYLARVRGAEVTPESVVIVNGVTQGLTLLVRVLHTAGHRYLAVESPSNGVQRDVLSSHGLSTVDVPVDEEGLDVGALARTPCRAVLVTPAHQFPLGTQLSPERRAALVRWAEDVNGIILEDDYDAEFQYDRLPVSCLQGLAPTRVALIGSVSKTLAPGLRLGWVVAPPALLDALRTTKRNDDFGGSVLEQHALAQLLTSGAYDGHLRKLRRRYRERRDALLTAVGRELPDWPVMGVAAGLHLLLEPPAAVDEAMLVRQAAARGLLIQGTRHMYGTLPPQPGLVLSFARGPVSMLHEGVHRLAESMGHALVGDHELDLAPEPPGHVSATAEDYF